MTAAELRTILREHIDGCAECQRIVRQNPFAIARDHAHLCFDGAQIHFRIQQAEEAEREAKA
jgi:hypothetical protein